MAFQVKDFPSIVAAMVNQMRASTDRITDYNVGSVARTLIEAPAVEIDELYQNMLHSLVEAIPTALYTAFGFELLAATEASGRVRFSIPAAVGTPTTIPAGTLVSDTGGQRTYRTIVDATIQAGQTEVTTGVRATVAGSSHNAGSGEVTTLVNPFGDASVTNEAQFTDGADAETDEQRRLRFLDYITALSRGPIASIEYGVKTVTLTDEAGIVTDRVKDAIAIERYELDPAEELGYVDVYVYDGINGASAALIAEAKKIIDGYVDGEGARVAGWKAAGIVVRVLAVTLQAVNITLTLTTRDGTLTAAQDLELDAALSNYIGSVAIGGTVYLSELIAAAMSVDGIVDAKVTAPAADVALAIGDKAIAGAYTYNLA